MKKLFLIIGAPGSGKTPDAELIAERNKDSFAHYSTGELLRAESASGSELGKEIESYTSKGELVPLKIVVNTIINAIKNSDKDVILIDGYPRSIEQMQELDILLDSENDVELVSVIEVVVSVDTARERVLGRNRGADDNEEVFNNRMLVFVEPLNAIEEFYEAKGLLHKIDGERGIEEIVDEMESYIKSKI
jgi:adenylate kinase